MAELTLEDPKASGLEQSELGREIRCGQRCGQRGVETEFVCLIGHHTIFGSFSETNEQLNVVYFFAKQVS